MRSIEIMLRLLMWQDQICTYYGSINMLHIYKVKPTINKQLKSELFCLLINKKTKDII